MISADPCRPITLMDLTRRCQIILRLDDLGREPYYPDAIIIIDNGVKTRLCDYMAGRDYDRWLDMMGL